MFSAILILLAMPFSDLSGSTGTQFKPLSKAVFFIFVANFLILMVLGAKHVESPFIEFGQVSTLIYFAHFLIIIPLISLLENTFIEMNKTFIEIDSRKEEIYIVEHATVVSGLGWWIKKAQSNIGYRELFDNDHPYPSTLQDLLKDKIQQRERTGPFLTGGPKAYCPELKVWVNENGMVSVDAPLPEEEYGTRKPFNWITPEQFVKDRGQTILFALVSYLRIKSFMFWYKNNKCIIISLPVVWLLDIKSYLYNYKKRIIISLIILFFIIMSFTSLTLLSTHIDTRIFTGPLLHCDAPRPWGIYFQDSATPQMEGLVELHNYILFHLFIILFGVGWLLISIVKSYSNTESPITNKYLGHGTLIELIWTIAPALILILIAFPSFKLLYLMDEVSDPAMAVLAEGHQWYWSYQYPDFLNIDDDFIEFDSYLVPESDLEDGALRMLEVDNRLIIPELTHVRFVTTGADVIHSLACPALGIKCDAYPGRLNQASLMINREGVFYGQCSEICGILHSSMPVVVESVSIGKFVSWLQGQ